VNCFIQTLNVISEQQEVAYRRAATMEVQVNSFIKTGLFRCNRHIFQDHEFVYHGMDESQDKRTMELAMKFQDREHQTFLSTMPVVEIYKSIRRPTLSSSSTKTFCSHRSSKTNKSALCEAINSFSFMKQFRECQEKKALSLSQ
jgi:hypothetical protein